MNKIGIIGGGFSGTMTAVQIIQKTLTPCEIIIASEKDSFNKGIAYRPYSKKYLLNVMVSKMSAFPDKPEHFLDWLMNRQEFVGQDRFLIGKSFLPRQLYGEYLTDIWNEAEKIAKSKNIDIKIIDGMVLNLDVNESGLVLSLDNKSDIEVDDCVIATGNNIPRNPKILNNEFYFSKKYYQNPWQLEAVTKVEKKKPVLIIGNGLTMVDTVLGLRENGFNGEIYSLSPHGFNILPHRHSGIQYSKLVEELPEKVSLYELIKLVNKHITAVRSLGISAEPIVDSLRPYTQKIWRNLSDNEKQLFMSRFRHLWGVARHRIPLHTYDRIQQLRINGKLFVYAGKIIDFVESENGILVEYFDKKFDCKKKIEVSRIINCTGPETDLMNLGDCFLKNCILKGFITQDKLKLGIRTDTETFEIFDSKGKRQSNLFTLGANLKGELWETTAVGELRGQAARLAEKLVSKTTAKKFFGWLHGNYLFTKK